MFEDLSGKFGKLKMPEGSLIKKLERIKKSSETSYGKGSSPTLFPDVIEQLRRAPEEISKKIEEVVSAKTEAIKANSEAVKNLESQINKIDQSIGSSKKDTEGFKNRLDKIDETVLELLSLYEVVSSTVNPFIGDKNNPMNEKIAEIEKKMNELGTKNPELPLHLIEDMENKFKGLENNIKELKKIVESKPIDENALVEKVALMVFEQLKPQSRQRPIYGGMPQQSYQVQQPNQVQQAYQVQQPTQQASQVQQQSLRAQQPPYYGTAQQAAPQYSEEEEGQGVRLSYLDTRPETSIILLNWIEFLMEKVGRNNLFDVLEYYMEIGWISEDVSSKMMAYASGIDYFVERPSWKLLPEDHTKSLLFIEQLRGRKVDKMLFSRLERDVDKIIRSSASEVTVH
ncbi:MAG: FlaD/FlaE family flagellar protein [Candidatus Methanoperedens sp.]|nr:FlaD/FlaE family flagellar protein [Candidatus Methanoperedens sp.]